MLLILAAVSLAGPALAAALPQSREKLRHCAAEWTRMKRTGEAAGRIWRDFWVVCRKV